MLPITIKGRILVRELCHQKLNWNILISTEDQNALSTLPTLELFAVFLAIICFDNILKTFSNISIKNAFVAVVAQVGYFLQVLRQRINFLNVD